MIIKSEKLNKYHKTHFFFFTIVVFFFIPSIINPLAKLAGELLSYLSSLAGEAGIETILALDFFLFFTKLFYGLFFSSYIFVYFDIALGVYVA